MSSTNGSRIPGYRTNVYPPTSSTPDVNLPGPTVNHSSSVVMYGPNTLISGNTVDFSHSLEGRSQFAAYGVINNSHITPSTVPSTGPPLYRRTSHEFAPAPSKQNPLPSPKKRRITRSQTAASRLSKLKQVYNQNELESKFNFTPPSRYKKMPILFTITDPTTAPLSTWLQQKAQAQAQRDNNRGSFFTHKIVGGNSIKAEITNKKETIISELPFEGDIPKISNEAEIIRSQLAYDSDLLNPLNPPRFNIDNIDDFSSTNSIFNSSEVTVISDEESSVEKEELIGEKDLSSWGEYEAVANSTSHIPFFSIDKILFFCYLNRNPPLPYQDLPIPLKDKHFDTRPRNNIEYHRIGKTCPVYLRSVEFTKIKGYIKDHLFFSEDFNVYSINETNESREYMFINRKVIESGCTLRNMLKGAREGTGPEIYDIFLAQKYADEVVVAEIVVVENEGTFLVPILEKGLRESK